MCARRIYTPVTRRTGIATAAGKVDFSPPVVVCENSALSSRTSAPGRYLGRPRSADVSFQKKTPSNPFVLPPPHIDALGFFHKRIFQYRFLFTRVHVPSSPSLSLYPCDLLASRQWRISNHFLGGGVKRCST